MLIISVLGQPAVAHGVVRSVHHLRNVRDAAVTAGLVAGSGQCYRPHADRLLHHPARRN